MTRASLLGLLVLLGFSRVQAQEGPLVRVSACEGVSEVELSRLLAIELAELPDGGSHAEIAVVCADNRVEIGASTEPSETRRTLTLEITPGERDALTRLLSLRIAELLATVEPLPREPPATPPDADAPALGPAPASTRRQAASAAIAARHMGPDGVWSYGARVGYDLELGSLMIAPDLSVAFGKHDASLARVSARDVSLGLLLAYRLSLTMLDVRIGPGVRAGHVSLSTDDVAGYRSRRYAAAWFGPFAAASLALHGRSAWQGLFGAELGYVTVPVRGNADDGTRLITLDGAWLTLTLGVRYAF